MAGHTCSPPLWEHFQLHLSSLARGWDNTACWTTCTQPSSRAQPGLRSMPPESPRSVEGGLSAPGPYSSQPFLLLSKTDLPKNWHQIKSASVFVWHSHGPVQPGCDMRYISKKEEFCETPPASGGLLLTDVCELRWSTLFLSAGQPETVCLICYHSQLVFSAVV